MPTRLKRLISPSDSEAQAFGKLTESIAPNLDGDVRRQVVATGSDTTDIAEAKWRRAVTESLAVLQARTSGGGAQYTHIQDMPSSTWNIPHNLGGYPAVAVVDSTGRLGHGAVDYQDTNNLTVSFSAGFSGKAYLVL